MPIAILYSVFVLYGSLVPLNIRPLDFGDAWLKFSHIPYLSLGTVRRADWVANILLYIPLAFMWCASANTRSRIGWGTPAFILCACAAFAVLIEFLQLWFPPRTVSQNDLIAETMGSGIGVIVWLIAGRRLMDMARTITQGGQAGLSAAFIAYFGVYFVYSLLPLDFLISGDELKAKLAADAITLGIASSCGGLLRCGLNLSLEVATFVPFGIFLALLMKRTGGGTPGALAGLMMGAVAGIFLEGVQIFLASGVTQGISVATRGFGMMVGIIIGRAWSMRWVTTMLPLARTLVIAGILAYGALFAVLASRGGWLTEDLWLRLESQHWLPFFYHYWTTEQRALESLLRNSVLYSPLGIAVWLWRFAGIQGQRAEVSGATLAFWLGAGMAVVMELSRFLKPVGHADPTNILIGAGAAWFAFRLTAWFASCLLSSSGKHPAAPRRSFLR
jgi:VanZ family protein